MPRFSTDAIILSSIDFMESDLIVTALSRDHGIISAIGKGAKRSRKRFPGTLEPFSDVTLEIFSRPNMDLFRLEGAVLNSANLGIREDLELFAHAAVLVELIREHLGPLDPCPVTYESLGQALRAMEPCNRWFPVWCVAMLKILRALGYGIDMADPASGGRPAEGLSPETMVFMTKALELDREILAKLNMSARVRLEIQRYLIRLCRRISDRPLKSLEFLAKLLDVGNT